MNDDDDDDDGDDDEEEDGRSRLTSFPTINLYIVLAISRNELTNTEVQDN